MSLADAALGLMNSDSLRIHQLGAGLSKAKELHLRRFTEVVVSSKVLYTVGFAAETSDILQYAKDKLNAKNVDMFVANEVGNDLGFDSDLNSVVLEIKLDLDNKVRLVGKIIVYIAESSNNL